MYDIPHISLVAEYVAKGSLYSVLHSKKKLSFVKVLKMASDAARGMNYLHQCKPPILHRDLKSMNLLVTAEYNVKVADFGLSKTFQKEVLNSKMGTLNWLAPEVLAGTEPYGLKSDVFSFGIILWEMITRESPYAGWNPLQIVKSMDRQERLPIPDTCPADYSKLISSCWAESTQDRPDFSDVLTSLKKLLQVAKKQARNQNEK